MLTTDQLVRRHFTKLDQTHEDVFNEVTWGVRRISMTRRDASTFFEADLQFPDFFSENAARVAAYQYFWGGDDRVGVETSFRDVVDRVAGTIAEFARQDGLVKDAETYTVFRAELTYILLHQIAAPNSPVWYNTGIVEKPQVSACFIQSIEDSMESIAELAKTEMIIFKGGSGTGTNFSSLRGSMERLAGGGTSSGPIAFLRGYDTMAGALKSGGKTRRAAKMVILDADHPDIEEFIELKVASEKVAHALIDAGYSSHFNDENGAYSLIHFQNANHSVRITKEFMDLVESDGDWLLIERTTGHTVKTVKARYLWNKLCTAAWQCGDPGVQFHDTINSWNPVGEIAQINGTNPCSEFIFVDDSACNLSSINLMKFVNFNKPRSPEFDVEGFEHTCRVMITGMEALVSHASYPTEKIGENSEKLRPLGLGYANLGAVLMCLGLQYDSECARKVAASITSMMHVSALDQSAKISNVVGPFREWDRVKTGFNRIVYRHWAAHAKLQTEIDTLAVNRLWSRANDLYCEVANHINDGGGLRNAQVTLIAPTGTISHLMGCDTTGIEPSIALSVEKELVGGSSLTLLNGSIIRTLSVLGYNAEKIIPKITAFLEGHGHLYGCPELMREHWPIFDTSLPPSASHLETCEYAEAKVRFISAEGHVRMVAAIQPFLSGGASKTVNVYHDVTVDYIEELYRQAYDMGLKSISIYRAGSKASEPLNVEKRAERDKDVIVPHEHHRRRVDTTALSVRHRVDIAGQEMYIHASPFSGGSIESGDIGEVFLDIAKEGSTTSGMFDCFAIMLSLGLQYGIPLDKVIEKFKGTRFDPQGITDDPNIRFTSSPIDYLVRWLESLKHSQVVQSSDSSYYQVTEIREESASFNGRYNSFEGPPCRLCGQIMQRTGTCWCCPSDGETSGCA